MPLMPKNQTVFSVSRNNKFVSKYAGLKDNSSPTKTINFFKHVDIKANDILQDDTTKVKYLVKDIKISQKAGARYGKASTNNFWVTVQIVDSYITATQNPVNITATNSVVSVNSQNVSGTISVNDIEKLTKQCEEEDRAMAEEIIALLKELVEKPKPLKRGMLSKFGDFLAKYTPIATGIGQLLLSFLV